MMARNTIVPFKGRIQKRKTNHLHTVIFGLQRAAGPYRRARFGPHNAQAQTAGLPPGSERHGVRSSCPAHALFRPGG